MTILTIEQEGTDWKEEFIKYFKVVLNSTEYKEKCENVKMKEGKICPFCKKEISKDHLEKHWRTEEICNVCWNSRVKTKWMFVYLADECMKDLDFIYGIQIEIKFKIKRAFSFPWTKVKTYVSYDSLEELTAKIIQKKGRFREIVKKIVKKMFAPILQKIAKKTGEESGRKLIKIRICSKLPYHTAIAASTLLFLKIYFDERYEETGDEGLRIWILNHYLTLKGYREYAECLEKSLDLNRHKKYLVWRSSLGSPFRVQYLRIEDIKEIIQCDKEETE